MERADWETNWSPLSPTQVNQLFAQHRGHWWIAGGWCLELFAGGPPRHHADIDIELLRSEHQLLHETLPGWQIFACRYPGKEILHLWEAGETLPPEVHDIWCRPTPTSPWGLQVMLMDDVFDSWTYRRDERIGGRIDELGMMVDGIPILVPEVQLLFKSKGRRAKDEFDFEYALPLLAPERTRWLHDALMVSDPQNPWLERLKRVIE